MGKIKHFIKDILKFIEYKSINKGRPTTPCVFQCRDGSPGLFSYVVHVLGFVRYAHKNNLIPIIDLKSFKNTYLDETSIGKINAWDYFFKQPSRLKLEEILLNDVDIFDTRDIERSTKMKMPWWDWECYDENSITCKMWRAYAQKYIHLSDNAQKVVDETYNTLFTSDDNVLGIQCRGTDYTRHKPKDHPVQPSPDMVIEKAEQLIAEKGYNKIFLATEDGIVFKKFKEHFGDMIVASDKTHVEYDGQSWVNNVLPSGQQEKFDHGMAYLVSMIMLTKCNAFIAGRTSGSIGVMLLSKGFDYSYIWDLGFYE